MLASYTGAETKVPLFRKDPESSRLGNKLIEVALRFLVEQGLERLTFRKLAEQMQSTEASVYRYFTNKYQLLCYLAYRGLCGISHYLAEKLPQTPVEQQLQLVLNLLDTSPKLYSESRFRQVIPMFMIWKNHEQEAETQAEIQTALAPLSSLQDLISEILINSGIPAHKTPLLESLLLFQNMGFSSLFLECAPLKKNEVPLFWEELLIQQSKAKAIVPSASPLVLEEIEETYNEDLYPANNTEDNQIEIEPDLTVFEVIPPVIAVPTPPSAAEQPQPQEEVLPLIEKQQPAAKSVLKEEVSLEALNNLGIAHIMLRKAGGYNLLEVKEFFSSYAPEQRESMLRKGKISFISYEGIPLELTEVLRVLGVSPAFNP